MRSKLWWVLVWGLGVWLGGCFGDGGGRASLGPSQLSSAPGEQALVSYLKASHQYALNAKNGPDTYTIQYSNLPNAGTTTFEGNAPAYSSTDTIALSKNGVLVATNVATSYYLLNPYVPLGQVSSTGTPYAVVTSSFPVPTTLIIGNAGPVDNLTYYHDSSKLVMDATATATYAVIANDSTTLLFCLDTTISGVTTQGTADGLADGSETDCYTVDASGDATLVSITLAAGGTTLKFQ